MSQTQRHYNFADEAIIKFDQFMRNISGQAKQSEASSRPSPAQSIEEAQLSKEDRRLSASLMRIDHVGEVCAQALYQGHALTARNADVKARMQSAASEENDHLLWCDERLTQLNTHRSHLNPLWYAGSFVMGVVSGVFGDKYNLGFVAETERQVVKHLDDHLQRLPQADQKSRAILVQMREDEEQHKTAAIEAGAAEFPAPVKTVMRGMSKVMTTIAFWV